jgi:hypothetical protein
MDREVFINKTWNIQIMNKNSKSRQKEFLEGRENAWNGQNIGIQIKDGFLYVIRELKN